ncbi:hypothetical protein M9H77_23526 [Catharanthus roseus]|uniref:Uncharacterized protein n=1 Tax=Catharanthus roseus TaxID=4058 RepID=A0ACC0AWE9_CATRO|nr:hypothetical protein M9H77_23526 [Catharanthus roseus]
MDGDDDEDDVNDLDNEFNYAQGYIKATLPQGEDADLSSSLRHEPQQPIPLLTNGQSVSGEIPTATPETRSVRSILELLGPVPVRIVDPSKDLNSYELGSVDWKEKVEGWQLKEEKIMVQMTNRYSEGKGDIKERGSNGEELQR